MILQQAFALKNGRYKLYIYGQSSQKYVPNNNTLSYELLMIEY